MRNVKIPIAGSEVDGYLALPASGAGPAVIVIQEWWGLVPHITDVADRFAAAGFTALAPDLYHGESSTEPDGAGKLMMALNIEQAAKDMSGAIDLLQERTGTEKVGVVGRTGSGKSTLLLALYRMFELGKGRVIIDGVDISTLSLKRLRQGE